MQMEEDCTARLSDEPVETCSRIAYVADLLLTNLKASKLLRRHIFSLFMTVFLASLETIFETAPFTDQLTIIQDPGFDAHFIDIQFKDMAFCWKISTV